MVQGHLSGAQDFFFPPFFHSSLTYLRVPDSSEY